MAASPPPVGLTPRDRALEKDVIRYYLQQTPLDENNLVVLPRADHDAARQDLRETLGSFDRQLHRGLAETSTPEGEPRPPDGHGLVASSTKPGGREHRRRGRRLGGVGAHFLKNSTCSPPPWGRVDDLNVLTRPACQGNMASSGVEQNQIARHQVWERIHQFLLEIRSQYALEHVDGCRATVEAEDIRDRETSTAIIRHG